MADLDALASEADFSVRVAALYPDGAQGPDLRRVAGWAAAHEYALADPGRIAAAVETDARFGLSAAWVRITEGLDPVLDACSEGDVSLRVDAGATFGATPGRGELVLFDPLGVSASGVTTPPLRETIGRVVESGGWVIPSGLPYHDAGAAAADELACTIATGIEYLRASRELAPRLALRFALGGELLVDVAKLRAARWLWRRIAAHAGLDEPDPLIVARTGRRNRTRTGAWVNQLRATIETVAAVVGGADEVITQPLSEPLGAPTASARRWALGIQNLLREETHLGRVCDPAAGAGAVEGLTESIARAAWARTREIEAAGGMEAALAAGLPQGWAKRTCARRLKSTRLVGATEFPAEHAPSLPVDADPGLPPAPLPCRLEEAP